MHDACKWDEKVCCVNTLPDIGAVASRAGNWMRCPVKWTQEGIGKRISRERVFGRVKRAEMYREGGIKWSKGKEKNLFTGVNVVTLCRRNCVICGRFWNNVTMLKTFTDVSPNLGVTGFQKECEKLGNRGKQRNLKVTGEFDAETSLLSPSEAL